MKYYLCWQCGCADPIHVPPVQYLVVPLTMARSRHLSSGTDHHDFKTLVRLLLAATFACNNFCKFIFHLHVFCSTFFMTVFSNFIWTVCVSSFFAHCLYMSKNEFVFNMLHSMCTQWSFFLYKYLFFVLLHKIFQLQFKCNIQWRFPNNNVFYFYKLSS